MLNFLKKLGGSKDSPKKSNNGPFDGDDGDQIIDDGKDYYWENKRLTEFLIQNYPKLSQKRQLYYQH